MAIRIDTLLTTKRFEGGGFSREQSETVARVLNEAFDMALKDIATRDDMKREFEALRARSPPKIAPPPRKIRRRSPRR